jgi:hypothetical protein
LSVQGRRQVGADAAQHIDGVVAREIGARLRFVERHRLVGSLAGLDLTHIGFEILQGALQLLEIGLVLAVRRDDLAEPGEGAGDALTLVSVVVGLGRHDRLGDLFGAQLGGVGGLVLVNPGLRFDQVEQTPRTRFARTDRAAILVEDESGLGPAFERCGIVYDEGQAHGSLAYDRARMTTGRISSTSPSPMNDDQPRRPFSRPCRVSGRASRGARQSLRS